MEEDGGRSKSAEASPLRMRTTSIDFELGISQMYFIQIYPNPIIFKKKVDYTGTVFNMAR